MIWTGLSYSVEISLVLYIRNLLYIVKATLLHLGTKIRSPLHVELIHRVRQLKGQFMVGNYVDKGAYK